MSYGKEELLNNFTKTGKNKHDVCDVIQFLFCAHYHLRRWLVCKLH
jgi:hypothetical protein